jgi:vancomycin resistance protein YoaR
MYEKYSGLPDTTKSTSQNGKRSLERPASREAGSSGGQVEYFQAPNRSGAAASAKRSNTRHAKARKRKLIVGLLSFAFLALIVLAVVVLANSCGQPVEVDFETGKFRSGVYINGMDLSNQTVDEVRTQLEANETYALNNISITLSGAEISATVSGADMNAFSNLNEVLEQALAGGANQVYYTTISIDEAALATRIDEINATTSKPPVDASFTFDFSSSGKPTPQYIDGQPGFGLDVASTISLIKQAVESGQYQTTLTPTLTTIEPAVTVAELQASVTEIGRFKTTYDFKGTAEDTEEQRIVLIPNRAFNVEKSADKINNQVVKPGRTWSFNDVVGDRTEKNGWKEANGIFGGDKLTLQYGGGVCQTSTTLYNALLQAYPYFDIERKEHSIPSTYVEMGLDATVDTGHIDFKFTNKSDFPVYIFAYYTNNKMASTRKRDITVVIYGSALPEGTEYRTRVKLVSVEPPGVDIITETNKLFVGEEKILAEARSKFVVDVYIDHYVNGVLIEEIFLREDIYPGNPLRKQVGTQPTPSPIPSPTPTPSTPSPE